MTNLTNLQKELKEIILTYEEKTSSRVDNKNYIKQYNSLIRKGNIDEDLVNFIVDSNDEINTRHHEFVEQTTRAIRDIGHIKHTDIEKLKELIETLDKTDKVDVNVKVEVKSWFNPATWSIGDAKFFLGTAVFIFVIAMTLLSTDFTSKMVKLYDTSVTVYKGK